MGPRRIVLATKSTARVALLRAAGVDFTAMPARVDERAIEAPLAAVGAGADAIALALAEAKAGAVAAAEPDALVIGADQTLAIDGHQLHKPANLAEAREQIRTLAGRSHRLYSALAGAKDGAIVWRHGEMAEMTLRPLGDGDIDAYLAEVGEAASASVGGYQVEGPGIRLFERIDGDYFAILGLPLLPLLAWLRSEGALK